MEEEQEPEVAPNTDEVEQEKITPPFEIQGTADSPPTEQSSSDNSPKEAEASPPPSLSPREGQAPVALSYESEESEEELSSADNTSTFIDLRDEESLSESLLLSESIEFRPSEDDRFIQVDSSLEGESQSMESSLHEASAEDDQMVAEPVRSLEPILDQRSEVVDTLIEKLQQASSPEEKVNRTSQKFIPSAVVHSILLRWKLANNWLLSLPQV